MITCKYCGREFKSKYAFYAHKCEGHISELNRKREEKKKNEESFSFVCDGCGRKFETLLSLRSHYRFCSDHKPKDKTSKYKTETGSYKCECGREWDNFQSLNAHLSYCDIHHSVVNKERKKRPHEISKKMSGWDKKTPEEIRKIKEKSARSRSERQKNGITKNAWKGKHHSEISKQHHRESAIKLRETIYKGCAAAYNIKACKYMDNLNEEKGWNLRHALNGGEVQKFGFYFDGYDERLNIVFEYDEPRHYKDVYENILTEKDIERQNYIIKNLNCEFYRYNEKLRLLYKVN